MLDSKKMPTDKPLKFLEEGFDVNKFLENLIENAMKEISPHNNNGLNSYCREECPSECSNISLIKNKKISELQTIIKPVTFEVQNLDLVYDYLKRQDFKKFLGVTSNSFHCIFHEDSSANATIFLNKENGHNLYKCNNPNCDFEGTTIIDCVMDLHGCTFSEAINFLMQVYCVDYEWYKQQQAIYSANLGLINRQDFAEKYPNTYKRIKFYRNILELFNHKAIKSLVNDNFTIQINGVLNAVFFISTRYVAYELGKDLSDISKRINILTYLGLIRKLKQDEIPIELLVRAKENQKELQRLATFYTIPAYDKEVLEFAEQKAIEFKHNNYSVKGFSREMLHRFNTDDAERVYPQLVGEEISQTSKYITSLMRENAIKMINEKGWTTENEIIDSVVFFFQGQQKFKEKQIKKILPEFLVMYGLCRTKLNKQLKGELGIGEEGYFNIIYRPDDN